MKYFFFSTPPSRNFSIQNNGMKRLERNPPGEGEEDSVDILIEESGETVSKARSGYSIFADTRTIERVKRKRRG